MTKYPVLIFMFSFLLLSGCQLLTIPNTQKEATLPHCLLPDETINQFLEDEHLYITADQSQRKKMLSDVKNIPERLVNLLSITGNDAASLNKSLSLFNQLPLLANESCTADRYLYLRLRQTQAQLTTIEELNAAKVRLNTAKVTIETQQQQIDALTQIEQAITSQREEK